MEILFFSGAGIIAVLTIFLGISNWVYLSSLSSKISGLETELEKKALELEALRKERQSLGSPQSKGTQQPFDQSGYSEHSSEQIEIVRNIRGEGFENYDAHSTDRPDVPHYQSPGPGGSEPEPQSDVLDVVDESNVPPRSGTITVALFSNAKKDTDFAAAWKRLSEILPTCSNPRIALDFSNVMFLYDRELSYLEKFRDIVQQAGGTISFVNCEAELSALLRGHPRLTRYVAG